jgi:hypothetical protein
VFLHFPSRFLINQPAAPSFSTYKMKGHIALLLTIPIFIEKHANVMIYPMVQNIATKVLTPTEKILLQPNYHKKKFGCRYTWNKNH